MDIGKLFLIFTFSFILIFLQSDLVNAEVFEIIILDSSSNENCNVTDTCLNPSEITILKGDTINWIRIPDVALSPYGAKVNDPEMSFLALDLSHKFKSAGIYEYTLNDYPWVVGKINVLYPQQMSGSQNSIKFSNVEKIDDYLHLQISGNLDTPSGVLHAFSSTGQHILNVEVPSNNDGSFNMEIIDKDDAYWEWKTGTYTIEFWSVDGSNKNQKSEIIKSSFELVVKDEKLFENQITTNIIQPLNENLVPDWVKNTALWYGENKISETEFLNAIRYLINQGILVVN